ncbi:phosphodiesterase [Mycolicibacterium sp. P1-18]|uniref:alkaline phosphatase family protein n=1 Tax=Mycolicibacterium sp. P1-18 TaxID=2024615 RepID=UPI0011F2DB02|nr:alkaline phosphatase family protein [Mycolicibacterium sp. P1-18]KAA0097879.1 phosphodiesterase [Mycolicibacterium sp. P1-18]
MGHARYIGRVGALAVTLGVGVAMATTPGLAYAEPTSDSSSSSESSPSAGGGAPSTKGTAGPGTAAGPKKPTSVTAGTGKSGTHGNSTGDDPKADEPKGDDAKGDEPKAAEPKADEPKDVDPKPVDDSPPIVIIDDDPEVVPAPEVTVGQPASTGSKNEHQVVTPTKTRDVTTAVAPASAAHQQSKTVSRTAAVDTSTPASTTRASLVSAPTPTVAAAAVTALAPVVAPRPQTLVTAIADFVDALFRPLLNPVNGSPFQIPILSAVLSLVRNEFERVFTPRPARVGSQPVVTQVDPTTQHVLVIGVDGTNLSRILADAENENFLDLMQHSTTAASSIVGHTTISNPSWTSILTGVWGERTGVINNVFTPWTYDKWPTVFDQLESIDRDVKTMTVANWNVINAISAAGTYGADVNTYVAQRPGDTNWIETDDAVAGRTVDALTAADAPNFLFSYFVGVDENGHMYGGASEEYKLAVRNMDDNLGDIMAAIAAREALGEDWTVIVVTDHGHQPQVGFGHGFQSPDETSTFVIARGSAFTAGDVNSQYEIVDATPTVVSLFGGTPRPGSDGVPLTSLGAGDEDPDDLRQALLDAIAANDHPDLVTNVALGLRTIFSTIPYYVFTFGNDNLAGLPSFLVLPAKILFDGLYVITNVPAQVVAFLTGVSGARIFPVLPPAPPMFPPSEDATLMTALGCDGGSGLPGESWCSAENVA